MNAIEIKNLTKNFKNKQAVSGLNMTVPKGAIYGFIGENGSGKSTTEKIICSLMFPTAGSIKIFGKDVFPKTGVLIESPGCFPNLSVWNNMLIQAYNLGISNPENEVRKVLKIVRMEGSAGNKYKNCSLGMKQRVGIAFALLGKKELLVLDEPINGLDQDGIRIVREILKDLAENHGCTVLISSHVLGELEKIATHYGIIRQGKMIKEMSAEQLEKDCPTYVALKTSNLSQAKAILEKKFSRVEEDEKGFIRVYDDVTAEAVASFLYERSIVVSALKTSKISLEEYYEHLMKEDKKIW